MARNADKLWVGVVWPAGKLLAELCEREGDKWRGREELEIGCGLGRMTRHLAGIFGEVYATDVSAEMIRGACARLGHLGNVLGGLAFIFLQNGTAGMTLSLLWLYAAVLIAAVLVRMI